MFLVEDRLGFGGDAQPDGGRSPPSANRFLKPDISRFLLSLNVLSALLYYFLLLLSLGAREKQTYPPLFYVRECPFYVNQPAAFQPFLFPETTLPFNNLPSRLWPLCRTRTPTPSVMKTPLFCPANEVAPFATLEP